MVPCRHAGGIGLDRGAARYAADRALSVARIVTIAPEFPFLDKLAAGLLADAGGDPAALARATILLPTRRAARALGEAFLRVSDGRALLLPRMMPVGDLDADELALIG